MTYPFNDYITYAQRRLELPLDESHDVVGAMVIEAMRLLPTDKFVARKRRTWSVVEGIVQIPMNVYDILGNNPLLLSYTPGMSELTVPDWYTNLTVDVLEFPADLSGLPLIPEAFDKAILSYIESEYILKGRWRKQQSTRADYEYSIRDYKMEIGRVRGQLNRMSDAQIEDYFRVITTPKIL